MFATIELFQSDLISHLVHKVKKHLVPRHSHLLPDNKLKCIHTLLKAVPNLMLQFSIHSLSQNQCESHTLGQHQYVTGTLKTELLPYGS